MNLKLPVPRHGRRRRGAGFESRSELGKGPAPGSSQLTQEVSGIVVVAQ